VAANKPRWIVGTHACQEALKSHPEKIREVCFQDLQDAKKPAWEALLKKVRVKPAQKGASFFKELSEFGHQSVAVATDHHPEWKEIGEGSSTVLFLDGIEDTHNLGAVLRTSWLMEVDGIYLPEKNSVKMSPAVCKVASGGAEHVPVEETHFLSEMKRLKEAGYWIYGFSDKASQSLYNVKFSPKTVFVFGSEEKGVRVPVLNECDEILSIPQASVGASYNVSVAVGIGLAELKRQLKV